MQHFELTPFEPTSLHEAFIQEVNADFTLEDLITGTRFWRMIDAAGNVLGVAIQIGLTGHYYFVPEHLQHVYPSLFDLHIRGENGRFYLPEVKSEAELLGAVLQAYSAYVLNDVKEHRLKASQLSHQLGKLHDQLNGSSEVFTLDYVIAFLNDALEYDRMAVSALFLECRVPCNMKMADHPTIQVGGGDAGDDVGPLGLLNGIFGTLANGYGRITADTASGKIQRFRRTLLEETLGA